MEINYTNIEKITIESFQFVDGFILNKHELIIGLIPENNEKIRVRIDSKFAKTEYLQVDKLELIQFEILKARINDWYVDENIPNQGKENDFIRWDKHLKATEFNVHRDISDDNFPDNLGKNYYNTSGEITILKLNEEFNSTFPIAYDKKLNGKTNDFCTGPLKIKSKNLKLKLI